MLLLDVLLRYPTITLLLMFAVLALRDGRHNTTSVLGALTTICVAALLFGTPHPDLTLPTIPHFIVRLIDIPSSALVWWFGRSLFEDDFSLGRLEWAGMASIILPVFWFRLTEFGLAPAYPNYLMISVSGISVLMMLHLIFVALSGRADDVIESRRNLRFYFVVGLVGITILAQISERIFADTHTLELNTFRAAIILPLVLFGLAWLIKYHPEKLAFQEIETIAAKPKIDPRDQLLHDSLLAQMETQKAYTEPSLTIGDLADKLNTPEHRLRALINKGMGYRNFSGFLNHYRIIAVQQAMEMPENARTPILTLALNEGFNSLAPFNRAFKAITGQTPTAYRSALLEKS